MKITNGDVNVNIKEIKKPELNSNLVAEYIINKTLNLSSKEKYLWEK